MENKHNWALMQGDVQYWGFEVAEYPEHLDYRAGAETFALNGIDMLSELPVYIIGEVAMLYEQYAQTEIAAITYGIGRHRNQVTYYYAADQDSDNEAGFTGAHTALQNGDHGLFVQLGDKHMMHKVLSNAPFAINCYDKPHTFGARLLLKSEKGASFMDHCRCGQFCFDLMCNLSTVEHAVLLICFPKNAQVGKPCIKIEHNGAHCLVDYQVVQSPVKLRCEHFPQAAVQVHVQAYFDLNARCSSTPFYRTPFVSRLSQNLDSQVLAFCSKLCIRCTTTT
ncbi:hypothetical protein MMC14_010417 [Varicellaria rhodocarpa]|nr:hypothetical protein [Varicellaria rhodocarpa]